MVSQPRTRRIRKLTGTVLSAALLVTLLPQTALAGDTWPFKDESAHGANQPSVHGYTSNQIADWSPQTDQDAALLRSRVPLQQRITPFKQTQANPALNPEVQMINVAGDYGNAFIENAPYTNKFAQYHFNFWQYIDYYSYWHGTATAYTPPEYYDDLAQSDWQQKWFEFGMLNIPNPTYTDAAHKNGVMSLAGVFFSNNDRGQQTYKQMIVKDENGNFPVAEKMIEMARYFGYDGYFLNQEEQNPNVAPADVPDYMAFMKALQKGGLYVQWYDSLNTASGANTFARTFNDNNISMLYDKTTKEQVSNSYFFDYGMGNTQINAAVNYLNNLNSSQGTDFDLYDVGFAGLEAGRDRFKSVQGTALSNKLAGGLPRLSLATLGADFVHAGLDEDMNKSWPVSNRSDNKYQWMTNLREQLWWSGPNVNPEHTAVSATNTVSDVYADNRYWPGIASVIAERSVVKDSNFYTDFNTGHGLSYYVNGAESSGDEWSNMSLQDVPVTWQWWQDTTGNRLDVDFDYGPEYDISANSRMNYKQIGGYNGGSSLVVNGALDQENFLRLYKSDLSVKADSKLSIAYNKPSADDASVLSAGLIFQDDPSEVVKVPVADSGKHTAGWVSAELNLGAYAGRDIAAFGLVFTPGQSTIADYQMNIGQLRIHDGSAVLPSAPAGLSIAQALPGTDEMIVKWEMEPDYSKVKQYNVYVNDKFMGGKYDETFYIKKLPSKSGVLKVVAVGADGREGAAATLSFDLNSAVSGVEAESAANGDFLVKWSNPGATEGAVKVTVKSTNWITTPEPVSREMTLPGGTTSALFQDMPVNGDEYTVTVQAGNTDKVSYNGAFIDTVSEPYAEAWSWNGNTLNLPMPTTRDWRYLYINEDGKDRSFPVTYFSGDAANRPMIIRGRTTKASLSFTSTAKVVTAVMEDYSGNKSQPLYLKGLYKVTFNGNGGSPAETVVQAVYGEPLNAPAVTKQGYELEGWYNGVEKWDFAGRTVPGELTLTAKWTLQAPEVQIVSEGSLRAGTTGILRAAGQGAGTLSYTWYVDKGAGYGEPVGTGEALTLAGLSESMTGYRYKAVVTGEGGLTGEAEYTLQVLPAGEEWITPAFGTDLPPLLETVQGEPLTLVVEPVGDIASIRWEMRGAEAEEWVPVSGVTGAVYRFTPGVENNGTQYRVVLTGKGEGDPGRITGTELTLKVYPAHESPAVQSFTASANPVTEGNPVTFSVVATVTYGELSYRWLKNDLVLEGAGGSSLTIEQTQAADAGAYKVEVINTRIIGNRPYVDILKTESIELAVNRQAVTPTTPPAWSGNPAATPSPSPTPSPTAGAQPKAVVISAAELSSPAVNGVVTVQLGQAAAVELPVNAGELLGTSSLRVQGDGIGLVLASELLGRLAGVLPADQLSGAKLLLKTGLKALDGAVLKTEAGVTLKGKLLEYDLSLSGADGTLRRLEAYPAPVSLSWTADGFQSKLLGLYRVESDGSLTYLGGVAEDGGLKASLDAKGTYALLEYSKQFSDVPAMHWAFDALRELSAKHLIQGVSELAYQPARNMTRAEFVQLTAKALRLSGDGGTAAFADVPEGAWYQQALSGMVQAGLITGRSPGAFQPNAEISREEMTVILMRAYHKQQGSSPAAAGSLSVKDAAEISDWAAGHVAEAAALGLVKGRADGTFAPKAPATRAEAAQMLLNYMK
ncbi:S-layer homology domain-containing protein [Paenibacillus tritici]|uniref:endo-beta-N-acetylglucosaminidase n=1 Tax=Paenibacillus tritici TaxID=1873425 RepID=UPI001BABE0D1|nr:S-layer homology domain-containing protein [Paenibacillus tritici]QUL53214.1 S-layer homology domain-containing protein [Paenibacillus tritici]